MKALDSFAEKYGPRRIYIGKCIYCGATENLETEHAFPESLNGDLELLEASCRVCAVITGKFEGRFTGDTLKPARTVLGMKSKRGKKNQPKEFPMQIVRDGKEETHNVPLDEYMAVIPLWELGLAGKNPYGYHANGLQHGEARLIVFRAQSDEKTITLAEKYEADELKVTFPLYLEEFLRMIAKIAYCFAVAKYGLKEIEEAYVLPAILGKSKNMLEDLLHWIGGDGTQELYTLSKHAKADHVAATGILNGEIRVRVKLFKNVETPEYYVEVGRISNRLRAFYKGVGLGRA
jgi:hypothetical protein